jgi:sugar/nucleoside kinase (ribokinase family)
MSAYDVCVIGHVVCDRNVIGGVERPPAPGGAAYYASMAHLALGLKILVMTKVAPADEALLLGGLRAHGAQVVNLSTPSSSVFRNIDAPERPSGRRQRVDAIAAPFGPDDVHDVRARIWQIGPLTKEDLGPELVTRCRAAGGLVGLDVQGLTRAVEGGEVHAHRPARAAEYARGLDVLKADEDEVAIFTGADDVAAAAEHARRTGSREVLITKADRGSTIFGPAGRIAIEAVPPRRDVDATGCGDTYLAAYLARRLTSDDLFECGAFAAAVAGIKIEGFGPFRGTAAEVATRRAALRAGSEPPSGRR